MRRIGYITVGILAAISLLFAGASWAGTTDLESSSQSIVVKQIDYTTSSSVGQSLYKAQCPSGFSPVGGGGLAYNGGSVIPLQGSAPYNDGNLGWEVNYNAPSTAYTVYVYAICLDLS